MLLVVGGSPVSSAGPKAKWTSLFLSCCERDDGGLGRLRRLCRLTLPQKMRGQVPVLPLIRDHCHRFLVIARHLSRERVVLSW
jgi:hypothetical protein